MTTNKDVRQFLEQVRDCGWSVHHTRRHIRLRSPDRTRLVDCPRTPSDPRSLRNVRAQLRRAGANL